MPLAFPKNVRRVPKFLDDDGVFRYPDKREVCQLTSKKGMDEYVRRKRVMWERQGKTCIICGNPLAWGMAMFEHQDGRGFSGSHRDDRVEKDGKPYNGVAHALCNSEKGSKRIDYFEVP